MHFGSKFVTRCLFSRTNCVLAAMFTACGMLLHPPAVHGEDAKLSPDNIVARELAAKAAASVRDNWARLPTLKLKSRQLRR